MTLDLEGIKKRAKEHYDGIPKGIVQDDVTYLVGYVERLEQRVKELEGTFVPWRRLYQDEVTVSARQSQRIARLRQGVEFYARCCHSFQLDHVGSFDECEDGYCAAARDLLAEKEGGG